MANLNKVHLIGRLTRDPEVKTFQSGAKVTQFGFAVNNRRKNQNGDWEDEPCFLDCKAWNRGEHGRLADLCQEYLKKGHQAYIEGHLALEQWEDREGNKRQAHRIIVDQVQFLQPKEDGNIPGSNRPNAGDPRASHTRNAQAPTPDNDNLTEDIPF